MTRKIYLPALICLSAFLFMLLANQDIVFAAKNKQETVEFLGPIFYGTENMRNIFDHDLPIYKDDKNEQILAFDGNYTTNWGYNGHAGYDYDLIYEPVLAAADGTVAQARWNDVQNHRAGLGLFVDINHGNGYNTLYGHLSSLAVKAGDEIVANPEDRQGILGISGNTGNIFDDNGPCPDVEENIYCYPHLHFEVRLSGTRIVVDPYGWSPVDNADESDDPWQEKKARAVSVNLWKEDQAPSITDTIVYPNGTAVGEPAPPEGKIVLDDSDSIFTLDTNNCNLEKVIDDNYEGESFYTFEANTGTCTATWKISNPDGNNPQSGEYEVYVNIPSYNATTRGAEYFINHKNSDDTTLKENKAIVVQVAHFDWVYIGKYYFAWDDTETIVLSNNTLDGKKADAPGALVAADAIKFVSDVIESPQTPTHTPTPKPTKTTTPPPAPTKQIEAQISQSSDDAGPDWLCGFSISHNEVYFGTCDNGQGITSGFRFTNITIPQGTEILDAYIEYTADGPGTAELVIEFYGESSGDAQTFSYVSRPEDRSLTSASVTWSVPGTDLWELGQIRDSPDLSAIIQEIVNRPDWNSGNAIAIIAEDAGSSGNRRVIGFERPVWYPGVDYAAKLFVTYSESDPEPTPTPTSTPTSPPGPTPTPTPEPTEPPEECFCTLKFLSVEWNCYSSSIAKLAKLVSPLVKAAIHDEIDIELYYRVRDEILNQTTEGERYTNLYYAHTVEVVQILDGDSALREEAAEVVVLWQPNLQALVDGQGDTVVITSELMERTLAFIDQLSANTSPELQQIIAVELALHPPEEMIGMTMDQAWNHINGETPAEITLEWKPPLSNADPYEAKAGSTIPVKFSLADTEEEFVEDETVALQLVDADGNIVLGPVTIADKPKDGIVIQGKQYHFDVETKNLSAETYTLQISYDGMIPEQPATWIIILKGK